MKGKSEKHGGLVDTPLEAFAKRFLNPEDLCWAVTAEVRKEAKAALSSANIITTPRQIAQTRRMSILETCASVAIGFLVSVGITAVLLPAMGHEVSFSDNLFMTAVFTVASIIRGYGVRRVFNWLNIRNYSCKNTFSTEQNMKTFEQIAQAMFKAASAFLGFDEEAWEMLPEIEKQVWIAAAKAAHKEITEVH